MPASFNLLILDGVRFLEIMTPDLILPEDLRRWRSDKGYSLAKVAELLNVASPTTIKTWEDEKSDIPGPAELVLRWLIRGEAPFAADQPGSGLGSVAREDIGAVEMTVDAFEECLRRARAAGFGSVTEWIADLVRHELGAKPVVTEERQAVVYETPKRGRK